MGRKESGQLCFQVYICSESGYSFLVDKICLSNYVAMFDDGNDKSKMSISAYMYSFL